MKQRGKGETDEFHVQRSTINDQRSTSNVLRSWLSSCVLCFLGVSCPGPRPCRCPCRVVVDLLALWDVSLGFDRFPTYDRWTDRLHTTSLFVQIDSFLFFCVWGGIPPLSPASQNQFMFMVVFVFISMPAVRWSSDGNRPPRPLPLPRPLPPLPE